MRVAERGFRTRVVDIVTTLLDASVYTKVDIAMLYRQRWHAELDLRSIKIALGMDVLRCKTPEMVRKEIGMTLAGYNVVRALMVKAAKEHGREPRRLSFKGALQTLLGFAEKLRESSAEEARVALGDHPGGGRQRRGGEPSRSCRAAGQETPAQALSALDDAQKESPSCFAERSLGLQEPPFGSAPVSGFLEMSASRGQPQQ